jgi:hypothetical protein
LSIKVKLTRIGPKYLAKRDAYLVIKLTGHVAQAAPIVLYGSSKAKAAGHPSLAIALKVTAPAQYADTLTSALP